MNAKLLLVLTWFFYLAQRKAADEVWFFCMIFSALLTFCAFFYSLENKSRPLKKGKSKK